MKTGEKIAKLRKDKNISQEALAEMLGLSRQSVSKWENGSALPTMENLSRLANIFDVPVSYLLDDTQQENRTVKTEAPLPAPERKNRKFPLRPLAAYVILAVFCMAFWVMDRRQSYDMQNRLDRISRLESEISSLRGQISGLGYSPSTVPNQDFADMSYKLLDYDTLTNTATLQFTAVPSSYTENTLFRVSVNSGGENVFADGQYSDGVFTAVVDVVCSDYMPVYFYLVEGQETKTYSFGALEDPSLAYVMKIKDFTVAGYAQSQKGKLYISGQVRATLSIPMYTGDQNTLLKKVKQATLTLTYGDKVIYKDNFEAILDESTNFETSFTEEDSKAAYASGRLGNADITYFHYLPEDIKADVPSGANLKLTLDMTDTDGQKYQAQESLTVE